MPKFNLNRIAEFNQDLIAIESTGLPIDLGDLGGQSIGELLTQIEQAMRVQLERGATLQQAIAETKMPENYRAGLWACMKCDDPSVALDCVTASAFAQQRLGRNLGNGLVYPLIVLVLSYFGFLFACNFLAPKIEAIYEQVDLVPSSSLSVLTVGRQLMPIWGPAFPVLLVVFLLWCRVRGSDWTWAWLPGSKKYFSATRKADFAQQVSRLMSGGMSEEESVSLALPILGQVDQAQPGQLPPLLRWAMHGDLGGEPRSRVLNMVANTYRKTAERQGKIWRVVVPAICGVLLGGVFVYAYGLSLFYPVITLLQDLSIPGGSYR